jgi:ankyrin repeat protein
VIRAMLEARPNSIRARDPETNAVPLHAAAARSSPETVDFLAVTWPRGLQIRDNDGWLPLHFAATREDANGPEVVRILARTWVPGLEVADDDGFLPLHIATQHGVLRVVQGLAEASPQGVRARTNDGSLPFHIACVTDAPDVVEYLANQWNQAVQERVHNGCLPLHTAARQSSSLGVVRLVANAYPAALELCDDALGWYALHWAAPRSLEVAQFIYRGFPRALRIRGTDGWLPLHLASQRDAAEALAVVQFFVAEWRGALLEKNVWGEAEPGSLPIHIAARYGHVDVVRFLATECPHALSRTDEQGRLPMHYGAERSLPVDLTPN